MKNKTYFGLIMAGGIGSRFWPMSRQEFPKQFIDIFGTGKTLLKQSFDRLSMICEPNQIGVITNSSYRAITQSQLPSINPDMLLLEPMRRNTAPCIAYAARKIALKNPDAALIISPSDHLILDDQNFQESCIKALEFSIEHNVLVTLGIKPHRPDTGYGYIQFDSSSQEKDPKGIFKVKTFTEKPNVELAKTFIQSGEFLWNTGIVICTAKTMIEAIAQYMPELDLLFKEGEQHYYTETESVFLEQAYARSTNISIDYGVMEKANNVYVLPVDFGWSDLGTWGSLYENLPKDESQNAVVGNNTVFYGTQNCMVHSSNGKLIAIQGLDDYIVVDSKDVLLICKKEDEQQIREIVTNVKMTKGEKFV
jgi:mannose-1-phosphate guanylyltransferase